MKPFLGIDLTTDKKNAQLNGNEFLVQKPSAALEAALSSSSERADETTKKSKLPLFFRICQYVCGIGALAIGSGILKADVSFRQGYQNAPALHWACGICAVIWLLLWAWSKLKAQTVLETEESAQTFSHLNSVANAIYKELSVPDDAKDIDVLSFFYVLKDGEIKAKTKGMQTAEYLNPEFKIFTDDQNLYLANLDGKYAFPFSSIVTMHTVQKHIRIAGWNKSEKPTKGIYKQYKMTSDNYAVHCKYYHILEVNHHGEHFGIYFPCYELPTIEECKR